MRFVTLTILASLMIPSLVACGAKGFSSAGGAVPAASSASLSSTSGNNAAGTGGSNSNVAVNPTYSSGNSGNTGNNVVLPKLKIDDADSLASYIDIMMAEISLKLQGIGGGSFSFTSNTVSTNLNFACSLGGKVSLVTTAGSSASFSLTVINVGVNSGSGTLVFQQCKIGQTGGRAPLQIDGTINLTSFGGSMRAVLGLTTGVHSITASSNAVLNGSLLLSTGDVVKTCDVNVSRHSEINSTIDIWNGFRARGAITSDATIQVCDFDFGRNFNLTF